MPLCPTCNGIGQFRRQRREGGFFYIECNRCKTTGAIHHDEAGKERPGPPGFRPLRVDNNGRLTWTA